MLRGIVSLVEEVIEDMQTTGEVIPERVWVRKYSGRFYLRTTPQVHAKLVREAPQHGVSLNALVNIKLASN